jgi:hypothetical protein
MKGIILDNLFQIEHQSCCPLPLCNLYMKKFTGNAPKILTQQRLLLLLFHNIVWLTEIE